MNPLERRDFRHNDLKGWVRQNRGDLIWACLTLVQHWVAQGAKLSWSASMPSYSEWASVMGGILESCEVPGFLGNLGLMKESANEENEAWESLVGIWAEREGFGQRRTVGNPEIDFERSLVSWVENNELALPLPRAEGIVRARALGRLLKSKKDNVFRIVLNNRPVNVALRCEVDKSKHQNVYWLEEMRG